MHYTILVGNIGNEGVAAGMKVYYIANSRKLALRWAAQAKSDGYENVVIKGHRRPLYDLLENHMVRFSDGTVAICLM